MKIRYLLLVIFVLQSINLFSQINEEKNIRDNYLIFQTGFILDGYNSMGFRTYFEYQKDLKENWQFGISYEHSRHMGNYLSDHAYNLNSNLSQLSFNGYYKLNLIKNRLFWTAGLGIGAVHVNWDNNDSFGVSMNASLTLNIRITKHIYIETSPLIVMLPFNRIYYSPMKIDHFDNYFAITFFPIGIKVKL